MRIRIFTKMFFLALVCVLAFSACNDAADGSHHKERKGKEKEKEQLIVQIDSLTQIYNEKGAKDPHTISKLISAYSEYRNKFREDERAPAYFQKAGEIAMAAGKWKKAAEIYKNFFNDFENHPNRDDVLYQLGAIFDLQLNDKENAKTTYEHYFKLYGDSMHIDQVKARLVDLDLTDEELLEKFRKKNNLD